MGIFTEEQTKLVVIDITEDDYCIAACDGQKVYDRIREAIGEKRKVEVSFAGVRDLTPAFLNSAVGQLYGIFPAELIEHNLSISSILEEDEIILKRVIERAKNYFKNAVSCRKALSEVLGGEDE